MTRRRAATLCSTLIVALGASACASDDSADGGAAAVGEQFPDVVKAEAERSSAGYTFSVTISSPYNSPDRYADSMRVRSADRVVYGERELTHDHADEQPFTRDITEVDVPDDVTEVVVEGRDQRSGWGGRTVTIQLP